MNEIFDFVDDCYIINLDRRVDRWDQITNHLNDLNIKKYKRFSAIENIKTPHIGCTLSHYYTLKSAMENNQKYILVLEDDCVFVNPNQLNYPNILNFLQTNYFDIFYFGISLYRSSIHYVNSYIGKVIGGCSTTHCLLYNVENVFKKIKDRYPDEKRMIELFEINRLSHSMISVDGLYNELKLVRYFTIPMVSDQRKSYSDITGNMADYKITLQEHI